MGTGLTVVEDGVDELVHVESVEVDIELMEDEVVPGGDIELIDETEVDIDPVVDMELIDE